MPDNADTMNDTSASLPSPKPIPTSRIKEVSNYQKVLLWQKRFFQAGFVIFAGLIIFCLVSLIQYFGDISSIVGYSILISYLLIGAVDWIQEKSKIKSRGLVVILVYLFILLFLSVFAIFIIPNLVSQIKLLVSQLPHYINQAQSWLNAYRVSINNLGLPFDFDPELLSKQSTEALNNFGSRALKEFVHFAFNTISLAVYSLSTIVLSIYFLIDGPRIWTGLLRPLSPEYLIHAHKLRDDLSRCLRGYFIGQIQLSSLSGVYVFIMYSLLGSKYALLLGIWQASVEIIPVIGGFLGIFLGVFVMLFDGSPLFGNPILKALIALIAYFSYTQIIKDNFLAPRIMGNAIGLHPVVVLLVVLIGAKLGGVSGVVFALPIAGLLNVVFDYALKLRNKNLASNIIVTSETASS